MKVKALFSSIDISASGLSAQRRKMEVIAENIANIDTTRTQKGGPYRRKIITFKKAKGIEDFRSVIRREGTRLVVTNERHIRGGLFGSGPQNIPGGVQVDKIVEDDTPPRLVYDPSHPDADENGYVAMPNINPVTEMVNVMTATRAYEANATVIEAAKNMAKRALEI